VKSKPGEGTLLASVVMSSPGAIVVGIAFFIGRSSTQLADFIRRTIELISIIVSWLVFRFLNKNQELDSNQKDKLEHTTNLFVGAAMFISGIVMIFIALFSSITGKGNVIPGLVIAVLGVTTNSWFWLRYRKLNSKNPDAILAVQSKLYCAKTMVDACVMISLGFIAIAPNGSMTQYVDLIGSIVVAIYLITNGIITIYGRKDILS
jgi:divalent metal cation (Fe/Co/Zn/Cd) transporter